MSRQKFFISLAIVILTLILAIYLSIDAKNRLKDSSLMVEKIEKEALVFSKLKKSWDNKDRNKRVISMLKRVAPAKTSNRGKFTKLTFKNLTTSKLNQLIKQIYQNPIQIKKLNITNENGSISLILEITK